ncbi:TonB-dependent receptor plug domain-containing protein [Candidatus Ruminimicrobiellum ovillum]|uniref:TonB-dependent receptor plug domain-containing protein n=1 Tax=Candidatus Ruminimicrobiellum ovillum TaxID=1947927 RepID=UPI00355A967F
MRKFISLLAVLSLAVSAFTQTVIAADYDEDENEGEVFLSLTKTAEPLSDLTTNLTIITEEEIKEKSAKTLGEIVEDEVGVSYKAYGPLGQAQSISMRGSAAGQVLVLVDGRPVNDIGTGGGADFTAIPASMIERVEIMRGSGAALYGTGAFGGVINVITKKATPLTPNVNPYFSYGTFNTINAGITGAYANDVISILIAPSMLSSDGYRKNSFYDSKNIFGKIGVNLTENSEIILSGQAYNADLGNPGSLTYASETAKQFEDNNYLKLDYNTKIEDFKVQVSGYNANYTRKAGDMYDAWGAYFSEYNTVNTGVKGNVTYKEMLTLGLEWDKTEFKQKDLIYDTEKINRSRENAAAYLQAILKFGDLTLIPVVRGDKNTDYEDVFTPALSAVYKLTDEIKVSGNVSKVWNAPTFGQIYGDDTWYAPAPNLKPEKGISSDLGIEYNIGTIGIGVTGFYITSEDLIQNIYDLETYKYIAQNVDEARQYGYEVEANYNMTKDIKHKLNYTYLRAEDTKTHTDLIYKPMHNLNYVITVKPIKDLKISADVSYVTTTLCETGDYLKDYCIVNARADYQIMKYVSLWVKGNNLTNDDKYQLSYGYPMPGITGTAGIDVRF